MVPRTVALVAVLLKVMNWRMSPPCIFLIVFVLPCTMALRSPPVSSLARTDTVPKAMTFCSGVYISAPLLWLMVFAVFPSFTTTMIQLIMLFAAVFVTKAMFQRTPTIVHGNVVVFNVVATLAFVHTWLTKMSSLAVGLRDPLTRGTFGLNLLKFRLDIMLLQRGRCDNVVVKLKAPIHWIA